MKLLQKHIKLLIIILLVFSQTLFAQNKIIDSLNTLANNAKNDIEKVDLYKQIAYTYLNIDLDKTIEYGEKMISLSNKNNYHIGLAEAHLKIGFAHYFKGDSDKATNHFDQALDFANQGNYQKGIASVYTAKGIVYFQSNDYYNAFVNYRKSLEINRKIDDKENIIACLINIGIIYGDIQDYESAIKYYEDALNLSKEIKNKNRIAHTQYSLSTLYLNTKNYKLAKQKCEEALKIYKDLNNTIFITTCYSQLGEISLGKGNYKEAITHLNKALNAGENLDKTYAVFNGIYQLLSETYYSLENYTLAEKYGLMAIEGYIIHNRNMKRTLAYEHLFKIHKKLNNTSKQAYYANLYFENVKYLEIEESNNLFVKEKIQLEVQELEHKYETEKLKEKERRNFITGIAIICAILFITGLIYFNYKKLKIAYKKVEISNRAKTTFLTKITHEIKTPLNAILGYSELLKDSPLKLYQKEFTKNINASAKTLLGMADDILDLSSYKTKSQKLIISQENLKQLLDYVIGITKINISEKKLIYNYNIDSSITKDVFIDKYRLQQILVNLINNAAKFTNKGSITLDVNLLEEKNDSYKILFSVKDTGIGIKKENYSKIFEEFFQEDSEYTRYYSGTGLGLPITNKLLNLMHSKLHFKSKVNHGSDFYFILTIKTSNTDVETEKTNIDKVVTTKNTKTKLDPKRTILIVEDNKLNMLLLVNMLKKQFSNMSIIEAVNGKQGVELFKKEKPDLVLMDLQMPVLSGYEASKQIREVSNTPIIAVTASVVENNIHKIKNCGINDFIKKPITLKAVRDKVTSFLN